MRKSNRLKDDGRIFLPDILGNFTGFHGYFMQHSHGRNKESAEIHSIFTKISLLAEWFIEVSKPFIAER
jgi:hypothetical protein